MMFKTKINREKTMTNDAAKIEAAAPATTKKTKAELLEDLEAAEKRVVEAEKELKELKRLEGLQKCADEIAQMREAFVNSGFTREEAMSLVLTCIETFVVPGRR